MSQNFDEIHWAFILIEYLQTCIASNLYLQSHSLKRVKVLTSQKIGKVDKRSTTNRLHEVRTNSTMSYSTNYSSISVISPIISPPRILEFPILPSIAEIEVIMFCMVREICKSIRCQWINLNCVREDLKKRLKRMTLSLKVW